MPNLAINNMHEIMQSFTIYIKLTYQEKCFITFIINHANFGFISSLEERNT